MTMLERSWRPEFDTAVVGTSPHYPGRRIIYYVGLRLRAFRLLAQPLRGFGARKALQEKEGRGLCRGTSSTESRAVRYPLTRLDVAALIPKDLVCVGLASKILESFQISGQVSMP